MAAVIVFVATIEIASAFPAVSRDALDQLHNMDATNVGVDRNGNFWFRDHTDHSVVTITPRGDRITVDLNADVQAIDVDRDRGIVTLAQFGRIVRVTALTGDVTAAFELPFTAASVCWMDGDHIAVAPATSQWRVEVWSTSRKAAVRMMGRVPEIKLPSAGAVLTRATLMRYDAKRDQLVTLEAFHGELVVFDRAGRIVRRATITHPRLEANLTWLEELDEQSKRNRELQTPSVWSYVRMSLSSDGSLWLSEKAEASGTVTIAKILPDGTVRRSMVDAPACASTRFEMWGDQFVFFRSSRSGQRCVAIVAIQEMSQ